MQLFGAKKAQVLDVGSGAPHLRLFFYNENHLSAHVALLFIAIG